MMTARALKFDIVPIIYGLLALIPFLGLIFNLLLFLKARKMKAHTEGKLYLAASVLLLILNLCNMYGQVMGLLALPPLDGTDNNKINTQVKAAIVNKLNCSADQIDSINLNWVHGANDGTISYTGQAYACRKAYQLRAECKDATDQSCTINFQEITSK